jgi:hypothetical protein
MYTKIWALKIFIYIIYQNVYLLSYMILYIMKAWLNQQLTL